MITKEQYKEAKKIIEQYEQQLNILAVSVSLHRCKECGERTVEKRGMVCNKCEAYREQ